VFVVPSYSNTDDTCHQAKLLKGTWDFVYKDRCGPTRNHKQELYLMTLKSKQRNMHENIGKGIKMQTKQGNQTRRHKVSVKEVKHIIT